MPLPEEFRKYITLHRLFSPRDPVLLAVSGGRDSVVLCHLFHQAGFRFGIVHCNFQLRGEESERDEIFVQALAAKYRVAFFVKRFDTGHYAENHKVSVQVAARELRYAWFEDIRHANGYAYIATAHHRNDNIETLLINFFRGTGIAGIRGILPRQGKIIRPLLFARQEEVETYRLQYGLRLVEDSSNLTDKYTRNYFRLNILPAIKKIIPEVEDNLADNIQRFSDIALMYQQAVDIHRKNLIEWRGEEAFIPVLKLKQSVPLATVVYELFKAFRFGAAQTTQILDLLDAEPGRVILSSTHRVIKDRKWLIISPLQQEKICAHILIEKGREKVAAGNLILKIRELPAEGFKIDRSKEAACLDLDKIAFPLLLRRWRQGDYFYPLGMKKKKKLSRFFIDQKLSLADKEAVWVLTSGNKIVWVAGMRIDDRFRITEQTKNILKLILVKD